MKIKAFVQSKKAALLGAFLAAVLLCGAPTGVYAEVTGWYCMRAGNEVPSLPREFSYLEDFGGCYVDRAADEDNRVIYLTFDAGYENGNIASILDTLAEHNARGAFFILENLITREPDLVRRMADEGHTVANHTASHRDMTSVASCEEFASELTRLEDAYRALTGNDMAKLYRPPEGKLSKQSISYANELGYRTVMWSFAYADWDNGSQPDPEASKRKIIENTHNGMIILLHPTSSTNAEILGALLDEWQAQGYRFGVLNEMG